jgi:xylulokinase
VYEEAFAVPPGAGGVVFLPYLSGERTPRFDPDARGAWAGLGLEHGRGHLLRAALEGVAFALREGLEALEEAGTAVPALRLAGGGTAEEPWQQLLADVLGRPLRVLPGEVAAVASARGAALLAGASSGVYKSWEDVLALAPEPDHSVLPGRASGAYDMAYARYRELYPSLYG